MALVKFYRGNKAKYDPTKFADGIYFSLDTKEILVNNISFGYYEQDHLEIDHVEYTAPNTIVIHYTNGTNSTVTLQNAQAGASLEKSKGGLMTPELVYKLNKLATEWDWYEG